MSLDTPSPYLPSAYTEDSNSLQVSMHEDDDEEEDEDEEEEEGEEDDEEEEEMHF